VRAALEWIDRLPRPLRTLETGCGLSTLVFILRGDDHVCITPDPDEPVQVRRYCNDHGIDDSGVTFHIERSEFLLPTLETRPLDLVLIDGSHSFPQVFIDYFYSAQSLKVGGTMVIDDVHLWTGKVLRDFLRTETEWEMIAEWDGRTIAFRKLAELQPRDWFEQPFVRDRSSLTRARIRMASSMLSQGDIRTLTHYAHATLRGLRARD
jgi:hypothetical protein